MIVIEYYKRVLGPSFFIFLTILFTLVTSTFEGFVFWWGGVATLLISMVMLTNRPLSLTALTWMVLIFLCVLLINIYFINPVFSPKGIYFVAYLLFGFVVFSKLPREVLLVICKSILYLYALLAVWGAIQYLTGHAYIIPVGDRINTIFYTPNSFAAALNLVLVPLIVFYIYQKTQKFYLLIMILLLFALIATQSRGGWLAFILSIIFLSFCVWRSDIGINKNSIKQILISFIAVISLFSVIQLNKINSNNTEYSAIESIERITRTKDVASSGSHRLMLYDIAWSLIKQKPIVGYGFGNYQYYQLRDQKPPHIGNATRYVHNDYIQLWMETGILGLLSFIGLLSMFFLQIRFRYQSINREKKIIAIALTSGITAYLIHAAVDFVIYPPALLIMFGAYLGIANNLILDCNGNSNFFTYFFQNIKLRPIVLNSVICFFLIIWLSQPAIAQLLHDEAIRKTAKYKIDEATMLHEFARRFAPYESDYYKSEGTLWFQATKAGQFAESAARADELFEQGGSSNPYRVQNLLYRALLQRDYGYLLHSPESDKTILSWFEYILEWRPHYNSVQAEYVRTLNQYGFREEAEQRLNEYLERYPDSVSLRQVNDEFREKE